MGFSDRLRAWFKGEGKRTSPSKSTDSASRSSTKELDEFVRSREGVEGYLEPKTAIYSTTLLLVADDGEYLRRPIKDRAQAGDFCGRCNIPLYDAAKVGYPKRMRDYEQGRRPRKVDLSELPPWPGEDVAGSDSDGPPPPPSELEASASGGDLPELPEELTSLDDGTADGDRPADDATSDPEGKTGQAEPGASASPDDVAPGDASPDEPSPDELSLDGLSSEDVPPDDVPLDDVSTNDLPRDRHSLDERSPDERPPDDLSDSGPLDLGDPASERARDRRDRRRPGRGHLPSDDDPDGGNAR